MPSTQTTAPATLATTGTPQFQAPWSLARLPVVSIPCGVRQPTECRPAFSLSAQDDEAELLRLAAWCEQVLGFERPAGLGA